MDNLGVYYYTSENATVRYLVSAYEGTSVVDFTYYLVTLSVEEYLTTLDEDAYSNMDDGYTYVLLGTIEELVASAYTKDNFSIEDIGGIATGAKTIYVAKTGNDSTGDGSESNPYLTIQAAVDSLPRVSTYAYNIVIKEGVYDEYVYITDLTNGRVVNIDAASGESVQVRAMTMWNCDSFFNLSGIEFTGTTEDGYNSSLLINTCRGASLSEVTCENTVSSQYYGAFRFNLTPTVKLYNCTISNKAVALDVNASTVYLNSGCTGTGNTIAIRCGSGWGQAGGFVQKSGSSIEGTETTAYGGQIFDASDTGETAKIATGSYTGTGTYGSDNPCSLTFDFEPKILIIMPNTTASQPYSGYWIQGSNWMMVNWVGSSYSNFRNEMTVSGNKATWYSTSAINKQLNESNYTYYYIALA